MKRVLWALIVAATVAQADTFVDTFSTGMNPAYWSVLPWPASPGIYTVSNPPGGGVLLQKTGTNPGNQQNVSLVFDMGLIGGPISGDFSMQVDFQHAALTGGGLDQAELHSGFADNSVFFDVLESDNVHVWTGNYLGGTSLFRAPGACARVSQCTGGRSRHDDPRRERARFG